MVQEEVLAILMSERRFWTVKQLSMALQQSERITAINLQRLARNPYIIVQYEPIKQGMRKTYKYEEKQNGDATTNTEGRPLH